MESMTATEYCVSNAPDCSKRIDALHTESALIKQRFGGPLQFIIELPDMKISYTAT